MATGCTVVMSASQTTSVDSGLHRGTGRLPAAGDRAAGSGPTTPELYLWSFLRRSIPLVVSRYRLVQEAQRERDGYVYTLVRDLDVAR